MPKWLTAIFALFLSIQVFGARGKAVDKFLGSCFSPADVSIVQQPVPNETKSFYWIRPARKAKVMGITSDLIWLHETLLPTEQRAMFLPVFPAAAKH
jgi:hypothetical protein